MLYVIDSKWPHTVGVFRKSANDHRVREIRERIDAGANELDQHQRRRHCHCFQRFSCSLPNILLRSSMYDKWLQVAAMDGQEAALEKIKGYPHTRLQFGSLHTILESSQHFPFFHNQINRLCGRLPGANVTLLRHFLCVLMHFKPTLRST